MKKIASIDELGVHDIQIAGGKAANLGELTSAGFNVPPGFVLTTAAYDYFIEQKGLSRKVDKALEAVDVADDRSLQDASSSIRTAFEKIEIPLDLKDEVLREYKKLFKDHHERRFVAVRSSATAEDLPTASFAGQQDTFLNVSSPEDLLDKVRKCWSSLFTPRAIAYRSSKG
ncbi:MAG: phosphoenolpyruvate synthase, partial [Methanomassiliicoccales archaeon]|nr:phosphoenolpyruvate synthase [Methanomassiliicoccales archaeon]